MTVKKTTARLDISSHNSIHPNTIYSLSFSGYLDDKLKQYNYRDKDYRYKKQTVIEQFLNEQGFVLDSVACLEGIEIDLWKREIFET